MVRRRAAKTKAPAEGEATLPSSEEVRDKGAFDEQSEKLKASYERLSYRASLGINLALSILLYGFAALLVAAVVWLVHHKFL